MAGSAHSSFLKTILIPLFLAAILYALLALILLPFIRRHRSRYSQYLPMSAAVAAAEFPTSWRTQVSDALYNLFVPSTWGRQRAVVDGSGQHEDDLFDDEEGEGRDLEEGFKDDSEDEHEDERRRSLSRHR
ncbi:hypothetical protein PtrSN002B_010569 [Pyrenophora tritici-repentis]|nr:hypothetical protein A1F94_003939 [Pyrenophora tritici-repentis]KAI0617506.1 hypothetical protein TUN199_10496 [Pyrenophora tritici-repentis]KAI1525365.1 hypothetical protein PtrSN001A_010421 [Pyrenophora tritici-repentis]KAI1525817.1 hypothetical protein PtrSN001C_010482 [Pyrenophora tritici-repentis]KAI1532365.1 hypothetical protein PtrSN002B_010569 [Pyrenophora tritici-repentis]